MAGEDDVTEDAEEEGGDDRHADTDVGDRVPALLRRVIQRCVYQKRVVVTHICCKYQANQSVFVFNETIKFFPFSHVAFSYHLSLFKIEYDWLCKRVEGIAFFAALQLICCTTFV